MITKFFKIAHTTENHKCFYPTIITMPHINGVILKVFPINPQNSLTCIFGLTIIVNLQNRNGILMLICQDDK